MGSGPASSTLSALALSLPAAEEAMSLEEQVACAFERWRDAIYHYLISAGASPEAAEDLTQEAFYRLLRTLSEGGRIENAHTDRRRPACNR